MVNLLRAIIFSTAQAAHQRYDNVACRRGRDIYQHGVGGMLRYMHVGHAL